MKKETKPKEQRTNYYFLFLPLVMIMMIIFFVIDNDNSITGWLKNSSIIDVINQENLSDQGSFTTLVDKPVETGLQNIRKPVGPQTDCEASADQATKINLYRQYLENVHRLIVNFLQNRQYHEQLEKVKTIDLPDEINLILSDIAEYTKYLNSEYSTYEKIFPSENSIIGRFVKIVKKSGDEKQRELLRAKIISGLVILTDFIYSKELQDIFINRN